MSYQNNNINLGTGLSFITPTLATDINNLVTEDININYTLDTLSADYISTSNLGNDLRNGYSNNSNVISQIYTDVPLLFSILNNNIDNVNTTLSSSISTLNSDVVSLQNIYYPTGNQAYNSVTGSGTSLFSDNKYFVATSTAVYVNIPVKVSVSTNGTHGDLKIYICCTTSTSNPIYYGTEKTTLTLAMGAVDIVISGVLTGLVVGTSYRFGIARECTNSTTDINLLQLKNSAYIRWENDTYLNGFYNGNLKLSTTDTGLDVFGNLYLTNSSTNSSIITTNGETYGTLTRAQIQLGYNIGNTYSHYIHTAHSGTAGINRIDFYVCNGTANNSISSGVVNTMSLTGSGAVGIGTTNPTYGLHILNSISPIICVSDLASTGGSLYFGNANHGMGRGIRTNFTNGNDVVTYTAGTGAIGLQSSTGYLKLYGVNVGINVLAPTYMIQLSTDSAAKPGTNTWTIASDIRLKTNIEVADYSRCYSIMSNLDLKKYTWRDDIPELGIEFIKDRSKLGWIADDVKLLFPKAVNSNESMYGLSNVLDLNSDQIYACMYGTIKQLMINVEELQQKILS